MMNENPFQILFHDYHTEIEDLYYYLLDKIDYDEKEHSTMINEVVASAFAFIGMRYLNIVEDYYENDDFTSFCKEMEFGQNRVFYYFLLGKLQFAWDIDFEPEDPFIQDDKSLENVMSSLVNNYKHVLVVLLKNKFTNDELIKIFSDFFYKENELTGDAEMFLNLESFFDELLIRR